MMRKKGKNTAASIATVLILTAFPAVAPAQMAGALHFDMAFPKGELGEQLDRDAYGIGGHFFFAPKASLLAIGLDIGWMNYGSESRREPFSTTIPDVTVEVNTKNNIVQGFLVLRAHMPSGPIRLYGDGIVGFNYLYTETTIKDSDEPDDEVASSTNQDDGVFAYGFGGGVMIPVHKAMADGTAGAREIEVLIDAGARYILGGEAEYLKKGSIRREGGVVTFDTIRSETDMLRLHVGVSVSF